MISFFKHGEWVEVMIDDRLLVLGKAVNRMYQQTKYCMAGCVDSAGNPSDEFWLPLLEKAYAKMHGGYEKLHGGKQTYAARDLCGAAPQTFSQGSEAYEELTDETNFQKRSGCPSPNAEQTVQV